MHIFSKISRFQTAAMHGLDLLRILWYRLSKDKIRIGSICNTRHLFITRRAPWPDTVAS